MCFRGRGRSTSPCIDGAGNDSAQATVEAAFLLPTFFLLLLLTLQPVCLLYTRSVMESAAAETARLMITAEGEDDEAYRAFALRRLQAIPDVSIFHVGGPYAWEFEFTRASATGGNVGVSIEGAVRPLPVLGVFAPAFGQVNAQGDVQLSVGVTYEGRPSWLEGNYDSWIAEEG